MVVYLRLYNGEGLLVRVTTSAAKAIAFMDVHFGVQRDV